MALREPGIRGHQAAAGWLFLAPVIVILGLFLVLPIAMAAWVSFSDWNGNGSPLGANAHFVGLENYRHLLTTPGLDQSNFGTSLRNNFYYVLLVVPIQTAVALFLAVLVNRRVKASASSGRRSTSRRSRARSRSPSSSSSSSRRPARSTSSCRTSA